MIWLSRTLCREDPREKSNSDNLNIPTGQQGLVKPVMPDSTREMMFEDLFRKEGLDDSFTFLTHGGLCKKLLREKGIAGGDGRTR